MFRREERSHMNTHTIVFTWIKRTILFGLISVLVLVVTIGVTIYLTLTFYKEMSAYRHRIELPNSIDVLEPIKIGGIDQWISIRGHNRDAPILLYLHGGPGFHMIRFAHEFAGPWEEFFTVVFWDQRGAGKSYYTTAQIGDAMSVDRMLDDTSEVIDYLRARFNRKKIFVVGQSWGSILGIHMAKRHPDWLYAYVGVGQQVNSVEGRRTTYHQLLKLLEEKGDQAGIETLKNMAPYPDAHIPVETYYRHWNQVQRIMTPLGINEWHQKTDSVKAQLLMLSILLRSHTISFSELYRDVFSDDHPSTLPSFKQGVLQTDIPAQVGYEFEVPIFFVSGKHDWQVYYQMSADYFEQINAPYKEMLLLENSAHLVVVEEPGRFLNFLVNWVLPFASSSEK